MDLDEIRQRLVRWQADLAAFTTNYSDLVISEGYQLANSPDWKGEATRQKVPPAVKAVEDLSERLDLLRQVINEVERRSNKLKLLISASDLAEMQRLLTTDSIVLQTIAIPIEERQALGPSERTERIAPEALFAQMTASYNGAARVFRELKEAWNDTMNKVAALKDKSQALHRRLTALGRTVVPDQLTAFDQQIAALEKSWSEDVLAVGDLQPGCDQALVKAETQVSLFERQRDQLPEELAYRGRVCGLLQDSRNELLRLHSECTNKFDKLSLEKPPSVKALVDQLAALKTNLQNQQWETVRLGLEQWEVAQEPVRTALSGQKVALKILLDRRTRLIQRFSTVKAETDAASRDGLKDKPLNKFLQLAEAQVNGQMDLQATETAVHSAEVRLGELLARKDTWKL